MSVFYELPDQLFKELSEFYVNYINVKQSNSEDNQQPNSQDQDKNKFEVLFKQIEKIISNVVDDTLKTKPYLCSGYQTRYREFFDLELKNLEKNSSLPKMLNLKKKLLAYMIEVINKINPDKLSTYGYIVTPETCGIGYQPVLTQYLAKIKDKIKENSIQLLFLQIKDVAKAEIEEIESIASVLNEEKKINIDEIKNYITETLDIPESSLDTSDELNSEYIINELTKKYNDFLSIKSINFTQEIKNKIKKSVVEIVLIEHKLKKIYNPKKQLLFSKAIKEFFDK